MGCPFTRAAIKRSNEMKYIVTIYDVDMMGSNHEIRFEFEVIGDVLDFVALCLENNHTAIVSPVKEEEND